MLHPLQLLVFISMININFPANAIFISSILSQIINFDLLSPDEIGDLLFDYSLEDYIQQDPSYDTVDSILIPQM